MQYEKISEKFVGHRVLLSNKYDLPIPLAHLCVVEHEILETSPSLKYFKSIFGCSNQGSWSLIDDWVVVEDLGAKQSFFEIPIEKR